MVQLTLTGKEQKKEELKVPVFIFSDGYEVEELSELIIKVKPTYLINCSNDVEALKNHVKRTVINNVVFLMNEEALNEIKVDYNLFKKIEVIDLFKD